MLNIESRILLPSYGTNTWLLYDDLSQEAILVDPAAPSEELLHRISQLGIQITMIFNTHGHGDHIGGNTWFKERLDAPLAIHSADAQMLVDNKKNLSHFLGTPLAEKEADIILEGGEVFKIGNHDLSVIHTPGHTPGCICLYGGKYLISGDTLFEMSIGRTDFPGGSHQQIISSIREKLFVLPDDVVVCPGHGPQTSIGLEKKNNPFLR